MKRFALALTIFLLAIPLYGWNGVGHKAIALIAYSHLTPSARSQVDALLAKHPDYERWTKDVAPESRGRLAFPEASICPDVIRNDPRFHDDGQPPTPDIPGLPPGSQTRHLSWHYTNIPFSSDGTPTIPPPDINVVAALGIFEKFGQMPEIEKTYALPWILHLIEDIHQPLHTTARFTAQHPQGDRGGNLVILNSGNLHSYWDSRLGSSDTEAFLEELTQLIQQRHPRPANLSMDVNGWAQEGFALRSQVYNFTGPGTAEDNANLTDEYSVTARTIALERAALAGYRLAEFLNERLR